MPSAPTDTREPASLHTIAVTSLDGRPETLGLYRGKVLLIVNVASACGFTPQYKGLEALYRRYKAKGLVVLGFPCNQFGHQEPGDAEEIRRFCSDAYDVSFPLFAKIEVNGPRAHPLFRLLKAQRPGALGSEAIKWNFTKFLVDRDGTVLDRYAPTTTPEAMEKDILAVLER
jgi:glutathione peroxidase